METLLDSSVPAPDSLPQMPLTMPVTTEDDADSLPLNDLFPASDLESSSKPEDSVAAPLDSSELKSLALDILDQMAGNPVMVGFSTELKSALEKLDDIRGPIKSNYRCVRRLQSLVKVTQKVLQVMEDSTF